jgi:copper homeostasis protein
MQNHFVLEICVESVACAVAAERGGAHRIELCGDLPAGGITPSSGLMRVARKNLGLPIHVIIRPRSGNFVYSVPEFEIMKDDIRTAKQLGMNGVVLGILDAKGNVDVERTKRLVDLAHPLPVTFHRAFDVSGNLGESLESVIQTGAHRILTSGGRRSATEHLAGLSQLVKAAEGRIAIMPGGGINARNVLRVIRQTSAREIHTSLGASAVASSEFGQGMLKSTGNHEAHRLVALEKNVRTLMSLVAGVRQDLGSSSIV